MNEKRHTLHDTRLMLLEPEELSQRLDHIDRAMNQARLDTVMLSSAANTYYVSGRVFCGFAIYIKSLRRFLWFVRRPSMLVGDDVHYIRKPEQIPEMLSNLGISVSNLGRVGLELDEMSFNHVQRQARALGIGEFGNADDVMSAARAVKTDFEQRQLKLSGVSHEHVYRQIPRMYRPEMTDIELQIEIERVSRLEGCLGLFRVSGPDMELHMGNVLAGDNADAPSPYDFAMGGMGASPSLPVGADGTVIRPGMAVMVDVNGNYTGYMTDMTRTFSLTTLPSHARKAHECSIRICRELSEMARPGVQARELFHRAEQIAASEGLADYFMGHRQKAGFVGHGLGIEINEAPVIAPRSRDILAPGNVFALEPKFVIPGVGAVGIENTYFVGENETTCLTNAPEEIISFE